MSDGLPQEGAVGRLLHELTIGTIQRVRAKDRYDARNHMREVELQFQFELSGTAQHVPSFETFEVHFDYGLFYAPGQRSSDLEEPHFTYGSKTSPAVGIHATVSEWLVDETNGAVIGAVVAVAAVGENVDFVGAVHLTFQGFGGLVEEDQVALVTDG